MPKISEFYGIKIYMYWDYRGPHYGPHFHAAYGEHRAIFQFQGRMISGKMPKTAKSLIKTWALENEEYLYYAWPCAVFKNPLPKIKGLK